MTPVHRMSVTYSPLERGDFTRGEVSVYNEQGALSPLSIYYLRAAELRSNLKPKQLLPLSLFATANRFGKEILTLIVFHFFGSRPWLPLSRTHFQLPFLSFFHIVR